MKTLTSIFAIFIFSLGAFAQEYDSYANNEIKITSTYCAMLNEGRMILISDGKIVNSDIEFLNGTTVKSNGILQKRDKSKVILQVGDCLDQNGNLIPPDITIIETGTFPSKTLSENKRKTTTSK